MCVCLNVSQWHTHENRMEKLFLNANDFVPHKHAEHTTQHVYYTRL